MYANKGPFQAVFPIRRRIRIRGFDIDLEKHLGLSPFGYDLEQRFKRFEIVMLQ
jgi:hypothetical protein